MRSTERMAPTTKPYRNQHRELERLAAAIPPDPNAKTAVAARHAIDGLRSVFVVHVKLQSGLLYPWMKAQGAAHLHEKAHEFSDAAANVARSIQTFSDRFSTSDAIASEPAAFSRAWQDVHGKLRRLLVAQERELYPLVDAFSGTAGAKTG